MDIKNVYRIFVVVALIISVSLNFSLSSKFNDLKTRVENLSFSQQQILDNVNNQTSHIQSVMHDIQREQSWISDISMEVNTEELEDGKAEAIFEWQVKELHEDSKVVFNYAFGKNQEYQTIPAEQVQKGLFQVKVPFDVEVEPNWEIGLMNRDDEQEKMEMEENIMEESVQNMLNYFVSASYNDVTKSGEVHTENLSYFGTAYYGILQTDINLHEGNYDITLMNFHVEQSIGVKEAYLLAYQDGDLVKEEKMKSDDQEHGPDGFFYSNGEMDKDMNLVIRVIYSNGETFEREVY